ncbi:porin family protein [Rugamonas apoptosis]|uniref:Porin family protein n=1 Tax=Rugamonas apoptosis TaxID=2758570 RepID=A0A7W2FE18_9BURK|nr:porin family protein [Rugamonas apoptosis]MBA5689922.1 porin family protein [Rugamonas apoptosis]
MKKVILTLIASAATAGAAQAQTGAAGHPYIGVGVASADHNYAAGGMGGTNLISDGWKASAKIFGGYDFNRNLGVEVGYTDLRSSDFSYTRDGKGINGYSNGYGAYVAGKYTMPVNEQFSAYGKLGLAYSKRKVETNDGQRLNDHDTGAYAALGAEFKLNQNVSFVAEYERYGKTKDYGAKPNVVSVGVKYSF